MKQNEPKATERFGFQGSTKPRGPRGQTRPRSRGHAAPAPRGARGRKPNARAPTEPREGTPLPPKIVRGDSETFNWTALHVKRPRCFLPRMAPHAARCSGARLATPGKGPGLAGARRRARGPHQHPRSGTCRIGSPAGPGCGSSPTGAWHSGAHLATAVRAHMERRTHLCHHRNNGSHRHSS